jgi:hypothetical protein
MGQGARGDEKLCAPGLQNWRVASFLAAEGVSLLPDAHALFVDAVSDNLYLALELLERRAIGDHSPDETPLSFPAYTGRSQADDGMDPLQLWEAFVSSVDLAPTTVSRWRAVFVKLKDDFPSTSIGGAHTRSSRCGDHRIGERCKKRRHRLIRVDTCCPQSLRLGRAE